MDFVSRLPRTLCRPDAVWVIVDRLTKSAHFLAVRMTFTLKKFCQVYINEIFQLHGVLYRIGQRSHIYCTLLEEFPKGYEDTIDDEHCISSADKWLEGQDHIGFRGHATSMRLGS